MKVKIVCKNENYEKYKEMLEKSGFTVSEDANLLFKEEDYTQDSIVGKYNNRYEIIHYGNILYVESYGHEIIIHTAELSYLIKEKLYEIEGMFQDKGFIRINKSVVVNKNQIKEIHPTFNMKLILVMKNKTKLEVTRSYFNQFKEYIGF